MGIIDPEVSLKIQPELMAGESPLWTGRPNLRVNFHSDDLFGLLKFLLGCGLLICLYMGDLGYWGNGFRGHIPTLTRNPFFVFWRLLLILFFLFLLQLVLGMSVYVFWLKRRTYYAVTNRRVLVIQEAWSRKTFWKYISAITTIEREGSPAGTLWFGPKYQVVGKRRQRVSRNPFIIRDVPVFAEIDDLDSVYRMVLDLREQTAKTPVLQRRDGERRF